MVPSFLLWCGYIYLVLSCHIGYAGKNLLSISVDVVYSFLSAMITHYYYWSPGEFLTFISWDNISPNITHFSLLHISKMYAAKANFYFRHLILPCLLFIVLVLFWFGSPSCGGREEAFEWGCHFLTRLYGMINILKAMLVQQQSLSAAILAVFLLV